jgi:hypothetical protein
MLALVVPRLTAPQMAAAAAPTSMAYRINMPRKFPSIWDEF